MFYTPHFVLMTLVTSTYFSPVRSCLSQVVIREGRGFCRGDGACMFAVAALDGAEVGKTPVGVVEKYVSFLGCLEYIHIYYTSQCIYEYMYLVYII